MKQWLCISLVLYSMGAIGFAARAQDEEAISSAVPAQRIEADTIRAAQANAVQNLYAEIARLQLGGPWTVGNYLTAIEGQDEFTKFLESANQVGGPRWMNETCQVQLGISTVRVKTALTGLANARGEKSPLFAEQIIRAAQRWPAGVDATGSSVLPAALVKIKPWRGDPWAGVGEEQRREALVAANAIASRRVMESIGSVRLTDKATLADGLAVPEVAQRVQQWLAARPVRRVEFREDLEVEVAFAVERRDFYDVVRDALARQKQIEVPASEREWKRVEADFLKRCVSAVGRARVKGNQVRPVEQGFKLPERPPQWADEEIEVTGRSPAGGTDLRAVAAADSDAMATLRGRIDQLQIGDETLAELVKHDPRAAEAVSRFLSEVRPEKTDPGPEKGIRVRIRAHLSGLWEELRRQYGV